MYAHMMNEELALSQSNNVSYHYNIFSMMIQPW